MSVRKRTSASRVERRRTRGNGVPGVGVDAKSKLVKSPEGRFGMVVPPEPEFIRAAIEAGTCPWCGRGPWKMLAGHTVRSHGVSPAQLRDMAGLTKDASICSPALSAERSRFNQDRGLKPPPAQPGRTASYSPAGLAVQREQGRRRGIEMRDRGTIPRTKVTGPRKPRNTCSVCGNPIPFVPGNARRTTCGDECLRRRKSANMARQRRLS